jgi:hypothetical protein
MELVTVLARTIALADVRSRPKEESGSADNVRVLPRR